MLKIVNCLLVSKNKFESSKSGKTYYSAKFLVGEVLLSVDLSLQQFGELNQGSNYTAELRPVEYFGRLTFALGSYVYGDEQF